jgi:cytochrome oxidase Cu insertion factor (SCO1/SenC/PrrC family)
MDRKTLLTVLITSLLLVAALPTSSAYIGHQLSRADVADFELIDQNGIEYNFSQSTDQVNVVSFIFTVCPDVCPVITQSLKMVQNGLSEEDSADVQFISISVDPKRDTPERLQEYTELHGVDWPHLTGNATLLADVYSTFGVLVDEFVIEAHIANSEPTVVYVDPSGNSSEMMFAPSGWAMNEILFEEANWTIDASFGQYGHFVNSINGFESPSDWSWYWSLNMFNESSLSWEESTVGIDDIPSLNHSNLLWAASQANISLIPAPELENTTPSITVLYPDNTSVTHSLQTDFNAYHLTKGSFSSVATNVSFDSESSGHMLTSIDDVSNPSDQSWYWSLYTWNTSNSAWDESMVGVDDMVDPTYIAWAPNSTDTSTIPMPKSLQPSSVMDEQVCDGNGWEMGSGSGKHCMCDEGYQWAEDDRLSCVSVDDSEPEYSVGHSTITFILKGMKPVIAWTGDDWGADDFRSDVESVLSSYASASDASSLPGMPLVLALSGISMAAIVVRIGNGDDEDEA